MITAVVTNHNYGRYLKQCLESAMRYCDEILIYDDGSTDDSAQVIADLGLTSTYRPDATGSPVWGSNLGIEQASCEHLIFLDADNWLVAPPPITDADYTAAPILISQGDTGFFSNRWDYDDWFPMTAQDGRDRFARTKSNPYPWGGVWRTEFVKPLRWRHWDSTQFAADFRTAIDWLEAYPTFDYSREPFLVFRVHEGQWSASPERVLMEQEARACG